MKKYDTGLIYKAGVNPNLMQDACNKVINERISKDEEYKILPIPNSVKHGTL